MQEAIAHLSQLNDDLAQEGTGNFYYTSALAFLHQALLSLLQRSHARRTFGDGAGGQVVEDRITKDSRVPLWQQVETLKEETFVNDGSMESMEDTTCILRQQDARHSLAESLVEGFQRAAKGPFQKYSPSNSRGASSMQLQGKSR